MNQVDLGGCLAGDNGVQRGVRNTVQNRPRGTRMKFMSQIVSVPDNIERHTGPTQ